MGAPISFVKVDDFEKDSLVYANDLYLEVSNKKSPFFKALISKNCSADFYARYQSLFDASEKSKTDILYNSQGGGIVACGLEADSSTFVRFEELRKKIGSYVDSSTKNWKRLVIDLSDISHEVQLEMVDCLVYFKETFLFELPNWSTQQRDNKNSKSFDLLFVVGSDEQSEQIDKLENQAVKSHILARANNLVREFSVTPPNFLRPSDYVKKTKALLGSAKGVEVEFWDESQLREKKCGAFLAVSQGSTARDAGILHLKYSGSKKNAPLLCLVGKGICFDTGGMNIKVGSGMRHMKADMAGSAVVLSLFRALVESKVDFVVEAFLALAENHVGAEAYKTDDVVTASNGLTIEIVNTDAEGRMVLSDTLVQANLTNPDLIMDFATLTGSAVGAIGNRRSAVFSNREHLLEKAVSAGNKSGERVWPFPCGEDYLVDLQKSTVADLLQCRDEGGADHIFAATFLRQFVNENTPWLHVDMSGKRRKGGLGAIASELNGFGTRFAFEFVHEFFKEQK